MVKRMWIIGCLTVLALFFLPAWQDGEKAGIKASSNETVMRIGTFRRVDLLVAYYGSTIHDHWLKELKAKYDQAKTAGDAKKAAELEAQGAASQEFAHQQLAGEAMLTNVLDHLKDAFPAVAQEASVQVIVEQPLYLAKGVEVVDVTDLLVKPFTPVKKQSAGKEQ